MNDIADFIFTNASWDKFSTVSLQQRFAYLGGNCLLYILGEPRTGTLGSRIFTSP